MTFQLRIGAVALTCAALSTFGASAMAEETIRIEPRPYYGATVTIEQGVRVFRPLPSTSKVIVNPYGETPLSLGFNETTVNKKSYNYHQHEHSGSGGSHGYTGSSYYFPGAKIGTRY